MHRAVVVFVVLAAGAWKAPPPQDATPLPGVAGSVKFAVIGDNGTGETPQYDIGRRMADAHGRFPFDFVLMLGDNMYGRQEARDFVDKFEKPYADILRAGVPFYATLGNHDRPENRNYTGFNMEGHRYYTFVRSNVRFFVFDSNELDPQQLKWIGDTLGQSDDAWKICYFHHPLYSNAGRHGPDVELRVTLEPLLVKAGVNVVFSGHEHIYERIKPQKGITYFIDGSSGQLRKGDMEPTEQTAASFDQDQTFMLVEIAGDRMFFQTISRTGRIVDSGTVNRRPTT